METTVKCLTDEHKKQISCRFLQLFLFSAKRQAGKLRIPLFKSRSILLEKGAESRSTKCEADALTTTVDYCTGNITNRLHSVPT